MVTTTVASRDDAEKVVSSLVQERLVACGQIRGQIQSHYNWEGRQHCETEIPLALKTVPSLREKLVRRLAEIHPYDTPEIVITTVDTTESYQAWADSVTED